MSIPRVVLVLAVAAWTDAQSPVGWNPWADVQSGSGQNILCPGGQYRCSLGQTCCRHAGGTWACCPRPHATCCADMLHCCPYGYKCTSSGYCRRNNRKLIWSTKTAALPVEANTEDIPDEVDRDRLRVADIQDARNDVQKISRNFVMETDGQNIVCPGGRHRCPNGNTCCPHAGGGYSCCPHPHATCCHDLIHCCPMGYSCSTSAGTCRRGSHEIPWSVKKPAIQEVENNKESQELEQSLLMFADVNDGQNVVCPGGRYRCPYGNTCCPHAGGGYGCCPRPHATCCHDLIHCCPMGYSCSTSAGTCRKGSHEIPWSVKKPAIFSLLPSLNGQLSSQNEVTLDSPDSQNKLCPGGKYVCPSDQTCCHLLRPAGKWGCCRYQSAVCCPDMIHCCPRGSRCTKSRCESIDGSAAQWELAPVVTAYRSQRTRNGKPYTLW